MLVMIVVMMLATRLPYEISGFIMMGILIYFVCFFAFTGVFTLYEAYIKSGTIVPEGWFDLAPGVVEFAKLPVKEIIPVEDISPKEKEDLRKYIIEYEMEVQKIVDTKSEPEIERKVITEKKQKFIEYDENEEVEEDKITEYHTIPDEEELLQKDEPEIREQKSEIDKIRDRPRATDKVACRFCGEMKSKQGIRIHEKYCKERKNELED